MVPDETAKKNNNLNFLINITTFKKVTKVNYLFDIKIGTL